MNAIALQRTVSDMVAEYKEKDSALAARLSAFEALIRETEAAVSIGGAYGGSIWGSRGSPSPDERMMRKALLVSAWRAIYARLNMDSIASAKDKQEWEQTIADPPPLTMDNAVATFGDYLLRMRWHQMRGLAEVFSGLDPAYKSHSKVKIGVKALPKRVIISGFGGFSSYGRDRVHDIGNALAAYRGQPLMEYAELARLGDARGSGEVRFDGSPVKVYRNGKEEPWTPPNRGFWVRLFANGNAHLFFDPDALLGINRALAEFYGEVLPDAEEEDAKPAASRAVAKDLQFYPTPAAVIETVLDEASIWSRRQYSGDRPELRVLEPSCGDGRIMQAVIARGYKVLGFEVDPGRAATARAKGLAVVTANFLEQDPRADFDRVIMNPPFYGQHWRKHLSHALRFLKPGGVLVCILPATAEYDHEVSKEFGGRWHDLPVASFAESGTNIPTGYLIVRRRS